ncbi:kinesin-like protein KIN-4C [Tanacetum coccineum]
MRWFSSWCGKLARLAAMSCIYSKHTEFESYGCLQGARIPFYPDGVCRGLASLIYKEEVIDLLKGDENGKGVGPSHVPIQIRETTNSGILLACVTEVEFTLQEEMMSLMLRVFSITCHITIYMEQKRIAGMESGRLSAKLHLIDLAGSKRVKKTGMLGCAYEKVINVCNSVALIINDTRKKSNEGDELDGCCLVANCSCMILSMRPSLVVCIN